MLKNEILLALKKDYADAILRCNPGKSFTQHKWEFATHSGKSAVQVLRGEIFEKACVSEIATTVVLPNREHETCIEWLGIQIYPASPLVPMLTAVFEQVHERGERHCPCFFDVFPAVAYQEDRIDLFSGIGAVCKKHGRLYPDLPESYMRMVQVSEPGMGVGYGAGLALTGAESDQVFYADAANALLHSYFHIVDKRKNIPFTHQHMEDLESYRSALAAFNFMDNRFFKGGIKLGVPAESFILHMMPPVVRF